MKKELRYFVGKPGTPSFRISPDADRGFKRFWRQSSMRRARAVLTGKVLPENRAALQAFGKSLNELHESFVKASPSVDEKLVGLVVTDLVEAVDYANRLSPQIEAMKRVKGREARDDLRLILELIYETELDLLRRGVLRLKKNIPRLVESLGGDPSKDLPPVKRRRSRRPEGGASDNDS